MRRSKFAGAVILIGAHVFALGWIGWLILATTFGSGSSQLPDAGTDTETGQQVRILELLSQLTPAMRHSISEVVVNDDMEHMANAEGHCHPENGQICLRTRALDNPSVIWHEGGHAYFFYLNRVGSNFGQRWAAIPAAPLTNYGRMDIFEDVAEWMSEICLTVNGGRSALDNLGTINLLPYRQKLDLLRQYGFISDFAYTRILLRLM